MEDQQLDLIKDQLRLVVSTQKAILQEIEEIKNQIQSLAEADE